MENSTNTNIKSVELVRALHDNVCIEVHKDRYFGVATVTCNGHPVLVIDVENSTDDNVLWDWLDTAGPDFWTSIHDCILLLLVQIGELDDEHYQDWLVALNQEAFDDASSRVKNEGHGVLQFVERAYRAVAE